MAYLLGGARRARGVGAAHVAAAAHGPGGGLFAEILEQHAVAAVCIGEEKALHGLDAAAHSLAAILVDLAGKHQIDLGLPRAEHQHIRRRAVGHIVDHPEASEQQHVFVDGALGEIERRADETLADILVVGENACVIAQYKLKYPLALGAQREIVELVAAQEHHQTRPRRHLLHIVDVARLRQQFQGAVGRGRLQLVALAEVA